MKRFSLSLALLAIVFSFVFSACSEDSPNTPTPPVKEDNYIINNGKKSEIKFAAMGYATIPTMATTLCFSTKDLNDPEFLKGINLTKIEIRDNFLNFVKEGEPDEFTKKSEFIVKGEGIAIPFIQGYMGLEFEHSFKKVGINPKGIAIYEIKFKAVSNRGTKEESTLDFRYRGTLKTGGTGNVYEDDLKTYTEGGKITNPKEPTPTPEPSTPSFHNIKFSGNGVVFEITPEGNSPNVTYPFIIKGKNMFLDKNLNGNKDTGEGIEDNFVGDLSLPKKDGKALFVLRGDIREIKFKDYFNSKFYYDYPEYSNIEESKFDASKCTTLEGILLSTFGLTEINMSGCRSLKDIALSSNNLKTLDFKGLNKLENIAVTFNHDLSGKCDFSSCSNLKYIDFSRTSVSEIILPTSKSCKNLILQKTKIKSIDLSNGENIIELTYGSSVSTELDITPCNKLITANLFGNDELVKIIDKSPNRKTKLGRIVLNASKKLKEYDLSKYEGLYSVVASNGLGVELNTLINRLPNRASKKAGTLELSEEDAEKVKDNKMLKDKNWRVQTM